MKMKRGKMYKGSKPGERLACGLSEDGKIGVAIKNEKEAKAFIFASDEQLDKFIQDLLELKYEADMQGYEMSPVEKVRDDEEDYV